MEHGEFIAINFPEYELTYRLTDFGLSRIEWNSGKDHYLFTRGDECNNMAGVTSNNADKIYFANDKHLKAIDVQSGKALWTIKHEMALYGSTCAKMDYVKKPSDGIERILIMTCNSIGVFDAVDGKRITYSPSMMR